MLTLDWTFAASPAPAYSHLNEVMPSPDCNFGPISDPVSLDARTGIVANGLFLALATGVIVARAASTRHLQAEVQLFLC